VGELTGDPFVDGQKAFGNESSNAGVEETEQPEDRAVPGSTRRFHTPKGAQRLSLVVLGAAALAYWFTQWPLPDLLGSHPELAFYLVQPAIWCSVAVLAGYGWWRLEGRPRFSRLLVGIAFLVGFFHVAVLVIAGVIVGFGDSPLTGPLTSYPKNLLYIVTLLAGAEMARAYLFQVWRERGERIVFAGATVLLFAIAIPAGQWTPFGNTHEVFDVVGGIWAPGLALSALATFLVSFGGPGPSFAYRFAVVGFYWLSPILPNLDWPVLFLVGVVTPMASAWLVRSIYGDTREGLERMPAPTETKPAAPKPRWRRWTGWVVTAAAVAVLVLFATGAFGYRMVVVDGISMEPAYKRGDVAIVHDGVDPATLAVGNVILFRQGSLPVVHRIIAIEEGTAGRVFTTQGDNVGTPDPPVTVDRIEGKVVFLIPELGHVNLWLRRR
jgi:signal peptidase